MYSHLKEKKLLVIGSDTSNLRIIEAAREMGVYTISVDGITDYSRAPAKKAADEAWDIDYSDVERQIVKKNSNELHNTYKRYIENVKQLPRWTGLQVEEDNDNIIMIKCA